MISCGHILCLVFLDTGEFDLKKSRLYLLLSIASVCFLGMLTAILVSLYSGDAIAAGIRTMGPRLTGSEVTLRDAKLSVFKGRASLHGLIIGNPEDFKSEYAFAVDLIEIELEPLSLFSDTIKIKSIAVLAPEINYEMGFKGVNFKRIQKNIDAYLGTEEEETEAESAGLKVIIEDFVVHDGKVMVTSPMTNGKGAGISLPTFRLQNIGAEDSGASIQEVVGEFFAALTASIAKAVKASGNVLSRIFS